MREQAGVNGFFFIFFSIQVFYEHMFPFLLIEWTGVKYYAIAQARPGFLKKLPDVFKKMIVPSGSGGARF